MPMPAAVQQTSLEFYNLRVSVRAGHALHRSDRHAYDDLNNQFHASRAFRSSSDVRDAPGGSRGRSVPVQPKEPPTRPKARPRTESPSGPNKGSPGRSST